MPTNNPELNPFLRAMLDEGVINQDQIYNITKLRCIKYLLTDIGIQGLRENLFKLDELQNLSPACAEQLFTSNGMQAIREDLITVSEIIAINDYALLKIVFSDKGLQVLRDKQLEPAQFIGCSLYEAKALLTIYSSPDWLAALKDRSITPAQIAEMAKFWCIEYLLTDIGIQGLRENLFKLDELKNLSTACAKQLFTSNGMQALREDLISVSDIIAINTDYLLKIIFSEQGLQVLRDKQLKPAQFIDCNSLSAGKALLTISFKEIKNDSSQEKLYTKGDKLVFFKEIPYCITEKEIVQDAYDQLKPIQTKLS